MNKTWRTGLLLVVVFVMGIPAVVMVTFLLSPVWSWVEQTQRIEAMGHSGPAGWCFRLIFGLYVLAWIVGVWSVRRRIRRHS